jgi:hypothetical protein
MENRHEKSEAVYSLTRSSHRRFGCPKFNSVVQKINSNHVEGLCVFPEEMITEQIKSGDASVGHFHAERALREKGGGWDKT